MPQSDEKVDPQIVERIARTLIVESCCEKCEPDWRNYLPMAEAVTRDLGLHVVGWWCPIFENVSSENLGHTFPDHRICDASRHQPVFAASVFGRNVDRHS